jgi:alpha/beta superfamily hydrolase
MGAFARGYVLEAEVFRDLQQSGIPLTAHDLRNRQQRYSHSDLTVNGMAGDMKMSVYFVQAVAPLAHNFYIVRLSVGARVYTLVVMLQPPAWAQINGDTVAGDLETLIDQFPAPVSIQHRGHDLVVLDYREWKRRILRQQEQPNESTTLYRYERD